VVYCGGLENRFGLTANGGSNPSLSAIFFVNNWIHIAIWAVVIGAAFGYLWWQGQVQRLAAYVAETREELKKCSWPSWEELKGSTALIIIMVGLLGGYIFVVDYVLNKSAFNPFALAAMMLAGYVGWQFFQSKHQ
jgi:preprotein translocase subunit SecE